MYLLITILVFINFYLLNRSWNIEKTKELLLALPYMTKALFRIIFRRNCSGMDSYSRRTFYLLHLLLDDD